MGRNAGLSISEASGRRLNAGGVVVKVFVLLSRRVSVNCEI